MHRVVARRLELRCGDHDSTGAGPRTTSGVTGPTAKALPPFGDPAFGREPAERTIEPAGIGRARLVDTAFEHVLAVEMRALAIGRRSRVDDIGLVRP